MVSTKSKNHLAQAGDFLLLIKTPCSIACLNNHDQVNG